MRSITDPLIEQAKAIWHKCDSASCNDARPCALHAAIAGLLKEQSGSVEEAYAVWCAEQGNPSWLPNGVERLAFLAGYRAAKR